MKNLSNYGVASIDTEEMKETNGGKWWEIYEVISYIVEEWDDIKRGFKDGVEGRDYNYKK